MSILKKSDPVIANLIEKEKRRQVEQIELIPSENYVSGAVLEAVGSPLMNKYSEGEVGHRWYQGNQFIDEIEKVCKERALNLFKLDPRVWKVNVQAVTGSIANLAVLSALLSPGDKILSMFLYDGGHLSHGWQLPTGKKISFSSKIFQVNYYKVDVNSKVFDYEEIRKKAQEFRPKLIISGGTAYPREIDHQALGEIAHSVGAYYLADVAHEAGLIAAGINQSPFEFADVVVMTTRKTLRGPIGALIFAKNDLYPKIERAVFPGLQGGPQNHSIAGIAVALQEASSSEFREYARQVVKNAQVLSGELTKFGFEVCSGGTDKHLVLVDLKNQGMDGYQLALALESVGIIVNKNTVPGETKSPWRPSGIRLGTPAVTSRGMGKKEMEKIAGWIYAVEQVAPKALQSLSREDFTGNRKILKMAEEIKAFALQFPAPGINP